MATVKFILPNGVEQTTVVKPGYRVVSGAFALGLDEIGFGECGGNCTCGTCHVKVRQGNFGPINSDERGVLETFPKLYAESRLSCQLTVREDTGDVIVEWVP